MNILKKWQFWYWIIAIVAFNIFLFVKVYVDGSVIGNILSTNMLFMGTYLAIPFLLVGTLLNIKKKYFRAWLYLLILSIMGWIYFFIFELPS